MIYIDNDICHACSRCLARRVCRVKAIVQIDKDEAPFIDMHRCHGCFICAAECPFNAVKRLPLR